MAKWPFGGMFVARDVAAEQSRFDARETVSAGPIFGRKTFPAQDEAATREESVLRDAGLTPAAFQGFGKLVQEVIGAAYQAFHDGLHAALYVSAGLALAAGLLALITLRQPSVNSGS